MKRSTEIRDGRNYAAKLKEAMDDEYRLDGVTVVLRK
jgi:hypothetical protein